MIYFAILGCLLFFNSEHQVSAQVVPRPLSVHVLDNEFGGNAANMTCKLYRLAGQTMNDNFVLLSTQVTNAQGRILEFLSVDDYTPGIYRIWFGTGDYYGDKNIPTFFPGTQITFNATEPTTRDFHIPLILSPFGFGTYRGS